MIIRKDSDLFKRLFRASRSCEKVCTLELTLDELLSIVDSLCELDEELSYREWLKEHKHRGSIAGYIVLPAPELNDFMARNHLEKCVHDLKKMMNNPLISEDARNTLQDAISRVNENIFLRDNYIKLRNRHESLCKKIRLGYFPKYKEGEQ